MDSLSTARAHRAQIGLFGPRNSGKSSLLNALIGQSVAIVSEQAGTTTDVVDKAFELRGVGPALLSDTAGFDEAADDALGSSRVAASRAAAKRCDLALMVLNAADYAVEPWPAAQGEQLAQVREWLHGFQEAHTPWLLVLNQADRLTSEAQAAIEERLRQAIGVPAERILWTSTTSGAGLEELQAAMRRLLADFSDEGRLLTGGLVQKGDVVVLVMPQDKQAPKGRLIQAQSEMIRELLDIGAVAVCVTLEQTAAALAALQAPPALMICDSQVFREAHALAGDIPLTSFSVLFAAYKGDLSYFLQGAEVLQTLPPNAHILIAEACSHQPTNEDIGRVKLPRLLRKALGNGLQIDVLGARDYPDDLTGYDLIIHCGACMFNRKLVMSRLSQAKAQGVPMSNYGVIIAALHGILPDVTLPPQETVE